MKFEEYIPGVSTKKKSATYLNGYFVYETILSLKRIKSKYV